MNDSMTYTARRLGQGLSQRSARVLVAGVLLAAAALKGYQIATEPTVGHGLLGSRSLLIAQVELELLLGLWLLSGSFRRASWLTASFMFVIFVGVSLYKGVAGEPSCE